MNINKIASAQRAGTLRRRLKASKFIGDHEWEIPAAGDPIYTTVFDYYIEEEPEALEPPKAILPRCVTILSYVKEGHKPTELRHGNPAQALLSAERKKKQGYTVSVGVYKLRSKLPTDAGEGFCFLKPADVISAGDEYWSKGAWNPVSDTHVQANETVGKHNTVFRRSTAPRPVEVGEGYRALGPDEVLQVGDEYYDDGPNRWCVTGHQGFTVSSRQSRPYRRAVQKPDPKFDVGEGYRLLKADEVLEAGDEFYRRPDNTWMPTRYMGSRPSTTLETYRRKVDVVPTPEVGEGYVALKEGEALRPYDELRPKDNTVWLQMRHDRAPTPALLAGWFGRRYLGPSMVDPGPGFRILKPDETLKKGDEFYWGCCAGKLWEGTSSVNLTAGHNPMSSYRRAV